MNYQDFLGCIKNPEKELTEFKLSFSERDAIGRTIAAFSTKDGGRIWLGVDKKGIPQGMQCEDDLQAKIQDLARVIKPPAGVSVTLIPHDPKKDLYIVCIEVQKGNGIYCYKRVSYERRGDTNHPLNPDEIFEIQRDIKKIYYDQQQASCNERPALISDIDERKIKQYYDRKGKKVETIDISRFLLNHDLLINGTMQVTNAAIMLFGKDTSKFIPQCKISLCEFPSNEVTNEFIKKEFEGDLLEILQKTFFEIRKTMNVYSFIEGINRVEIPEYPPETIREALINTIVHRDYYDTGTESFVRIFTDRIEIVNPATFPFESYTFEEIEKSGISKRRNPMIADFFEKMGFMEKEGRGLPYMKGMIKKHGLPDLKIDAGAKTFMITFFNVAEKLNGLKKSPFRTVREYDNLNDRQKEIIRYLRDNPAIRISRKDYIRITRVPPRTASRDLVDLCKRKVMRKEGTTRAARYHLF